MVKKQSAMMAQHLMLCSTTYAWCSNLYVAALKFIAVIASLVTILNCRVAIMRRLVCGPRFIQHTAVSDARDLLQLVCPAGEGSVTARRGYAAGHHATLSPFSLALAFHAAGPHRSEGTCIQKNPVGTTALGLAPFNIASRMRRKSS